MTFDAHLVDLRSRQERSRPPGTPRQVRYPLGELTIPAHVAHWATHRPDQAAVVFEGRTITYSELEGEISRAAGGLRLLGVRPGDRVAIHLPNCPQFVIAMMAVLRLGAVHVPVNPMFKETELQHELADSGASVVVTLDDLLPLVNAVRGDCAVHRVVVTTMAEGAGGAGARPSDQVLWSTLLQGDPVNDDLADLDALAALNYTGGTTGLPKGCQHTQRHMLYTAATAAGATAQTQDTGFVALCYLPIFWIAGEDLGILLPLVLGGTSVLMPRWNAQQALQLIDSQHATAMVGTVENYLELLDRSDLGDYDLSSLEDPMAVSFVRKLDSQVRSRWIDAVGARSVLREAAYGMTETHTMDASPYRMSANDRDLHEEPVFCGVPVPGTDVLVVDWETGSPLPIGEDGQIILRSPSVITGYWNNPAATAEQLRDGWLQTGDSGRLDEAGCLHYLGRRKEMIKVKGMSVFPAEVEMILSRHPQVRSVAVVPAPHPDRGQQPVAFVTLAPGANVTTTELHAYATDSMATYKVPVVVVVEDFPMTATGKIRKVELEEQAAAAARDTESPGIS
ncbi:AMP-binding protein [Leekyejoonella antrihumi]|uniref:AMP-binding protein n=1 Tax=Leekyejoonella antrihumi TaxID=1660198 RepID=A0A563E8U2_9MICO|nr:AMP-binding protein [Leekyejoonella antrihumi]TWP38927.1 AMP-binding protein [Leekyejoonella antrihumi]